ncbi:MAG TPA: DUF2339 domain-containing protein, partial [Chthoniobacteraceae bacterium]
MTPLLFFLLGLAGVLIVALFAQAKNAGAAVAALTERVATLERKLKRSETAPIPEQVVIPPSPLLSSPPLNAPGQVPHEEKLVPPDFSQPPPLPPPLPKPAPAAPSPVATPFNWEAFMGVKLFAWLGGLALFLGVVFMVKYSFENNLITPLGRIVIGGAVGLVLIATGWWLAEGRYRVTAQSLCATGIVILYADLFAARSFYGLISLTTAFFAMSAVTLGSFLLAANLSAQVIVILGLLGGFLTPALLPSGSDNAPALFLYIALLDLGVAAVALRKGWPYLVLLAAIGTALTQLGWAIQFFNAAKGGRAFWIFLGFEALFLAFHFGGRFALRNGGENNTRSEDALRRNTQTRASQSEASTNSPNTWTSAAAVLAGCTALGFCFWLLATPALAHRSIFFFSFVFLADAGVLALPVFGRAHRAIAFGAGALAFALVAAWIGLFAQHAPLLNALAAIVIFALLHAATVPASAWRPGMLPLTAAGTVTPFLLLIILIESVALRNPTPVFGVALILTG